MLGIGGVRALAALGLEPTVFHMNEGHSAFLVLERVRVLLTRGASLDDAVEQVRATTVVSPLTPGPAVGPPKTGNTSRSTDRVVGRSVENEKVGIGDSLSRGRSRSLSAAGR